MQTPSSASDAETPREDQADRARDWWGARELEVERELACSLQRRMEAQRTQLYAFKTEQSKWEHELQLRISKYAHDRKLLSEHNVELQEELTAMEEKFAAHQREMDMQVQHVIELEGLLYENRVDTQQMRELRERNEELLQDQTIHSLKSVLEQQDTAFDEKLKVTTAKYDQVKTINMALQRELPSLEQDVAAVEPQEDITWAMQSI
ncbi:hypothetical protein BBJ29_002894 [Phytophthora kernoviae]|uniref:Uncharacterized protein n=1 Tax=Phytophthora kernoviae TaxID=325452 RepID=A0A3F2RSN3_9STRA|nr:hypothetical protein BBJ29_002894 [Phytophthora kernoviae]RLN63482.1 hypothetical protein BBP00_00004135 [Phytophthora kernoviae]